MRINSVLEVSEANGPGKRGVVWVQGCARHCAGCFNKETQNPDKGKDVSIEEIFSRFDADILEGVTVSGGEPFDQPADLEKLLKKARQKGLNTLVYTGYSYEELADSMAQVLKLCDYIIDGPYIKDSPSKCRWAGSGNQRFLELENGKIKKDLTANEEYCQTAEIIIDESGNVIVTGFIED